MPAGGFGELWVRARAPAGRVPRRMLRPETTGRAEMLAGDAGDVGEQIVEVLRTGARSRGAGDDGEVLTGGNVMVLAEHTGRQASGRTQSCGKATSWRKPRGG